MVSRMDSTDSAKAFLRKCINGCKIEIGKTVFGVSMKRNMMVTVAATVD